MSHVNCRCTHLSYNGIDITESASIGVKSDRQHYLDSIKTLFEADLRNGSKNEDAINEMLKKEDYEALSVVKKVFDKNGTELNI